MGKDRYGVNPPFVSKSKEKAKEKASEDKFTHPKEIPSTKRNKKPDWIQGNVKRVGEKYGFLSDGVDDYFYTPSMIVSQSIENMEMGDKVIFTSSPSYRENQKKRADKIFVIGSCIKRDYNKYRPKWWIWIYESTR